MRIAATHVQNLLGYARSLGIDVAAIQRECLHDVSVDLTKPGNSVSLAEHCNIIQSLFAHTNDALLGLHFGCFLNVRAMGLIFEVSKSAIEIRQAIEFLRDFLKATFPVLHVEVEKAENKTTEIKLKCIVKDEFLKKTLLDATLVVMYRELRLMVGSQVPIKIVVPRKDLNPYRNALNENVKYGDAHALRFDSGLTDRALNKNSIFTLNEMLPAFMHLIERAKRVNSFSSSVKCMALNMATPNLPTLQQVASQFCMTERTFQRRLVAEGTSFRTIINDVKKDLARYLKKSSHLKTRDIAFMLGYSESSSYLHAARQWT